MLEPKKKSWSISSIFQLECASFLFFSTHLLSEGYANKIETLSRTHHKPQEGIRGAQAFLLIILSSYFQIYSALCCICCPFCVSEMMERSSLICLAITTAMSKLLSPRWLFQQAHYNLQLNSDVSCEHFFHVLQCFSIYFCKVDTVVIMCSQKLFHIDSI